MYTYYSGFNEGGLAILGRQNSLDEQDSDHVGHRLDIVQLEQPVEQSDGTFAERRLGSSRAEARGLMKYVYHKTERLKTWPIAILVEVADLDLVDGEEPPQFELEYYDADSDKETALYRTFPSPQNGGWCEKRMKVWWLRRMDSDDVAKLLDKVDWKSRVAGTMRGVGDIYRSEIAIYVV